MKTTFLSTLILVLALLSCKKDNVPATTPKDNILPAKSSDATFDHPAQIDPALLELLKKGL